MNNFLAWTKRFFLKSVLRQQMPGPEEQEQLHRWLAQVRDDDPGRLAMLELLSRHLLMNAASAGNLNNSAEIKLRSAERMEFARCFVLEYEQERQAAMERFKAADQRQRS